MTVIYVGVKKEEKSCVALHRINLTIKKNVMAVFFAF